MASAQSRFSFVVNTGAATTEFDVAHNLGSTPIAFQLFLVGRTEAVDTVGGANMVRGIGFGVSSSVRATTFAASQDGQPTMVCDRGHRNDAVLGVLDTAGAVAGLLDIVSIGSTNIRFVVDQQFATAYRVLGVAYGGSDLTNATILQFVNKTGTTGTLDVTGLGFTCADDEAVAFLMSNRDTAASPAVAVDSTMMFGCATAPASGKSWVWCGSNDDGTTNAVAKSYCRADQVIGLINALHNSCVARAAFDAWITDGFRLNYSEVDSTAAHRTYALVIKGGRWRAGSLQTQTDTTTDITVSSLPATPRGGLLMSHGLAASADDTLDADDTWSVGVVIGASDEAAQGSHDNDTAGTSQVSTALEFDACYVQVDSDAITGIMHCTAVNGTGWTFRMADADPAQAFVGWVALMDASSGTTYDETVAEDAAAELAIGFELESGLPDFAAEALLEFVEEVNPPPLESMGGGSFIPIATRSVVWDIFDRRRR